MPCFKRIGFVLTLAGFLAWPCHAQLQAQEATGRWSFKTYGPEQGLASTSLLCLSQDARGFLWVGTENGAYWYDGIRFQRLGRLDGLPSAQVAWLAPSRDGGMWIGTPEGAAKWKDGHLTLLNAISGFKNVSGLRATLDRHGLLWVGQGNRLLKEQPLGTFTAVPEAWAKRPLLLVSGTREDSLHAVTDLHEVVSVFPGGSRRTLSPAQGLSPLPIEGLQEDGTGQLWIATRHTLHAVKQGSGHAVDRSAWMPGTLSMGARLTRDAQGSVWIPTNGGLLRVNGDSREYLGTRQGLPSTWANHAFLDREGSLWVTGPGLFRLQGAGTLRSHTREMGLPSDVVWTLLRTKQGRLWAGTEDGLAWLGPSGWIIVPGTKGNSTSSLCEDDQGGLWASGMPGMVLWIRPGSTRAVPVKLRGLEAETAVLRLEPDGKGRIYGALDRGNLIVFAPQKPSEAQEVMIRHGKYRVFVQSMSRDNSGQLWCASDEGLWVLSQGRWFSTSPKGGLKHQEILEIAPLADGTAWISYKEPLGITRVSFGGGKFNALEHRTTGNGLPSDMVFSLAQDTRGALWVGTDRGVSRLEKDTSVHFGKNEGLVGEDCTQHGLFADANGEVWIGTSAGASHYRPTLEPPPARPPEPVILQVTAGSRTTRLPTLDLRPVPHRDATLEFRFAAPSFLNEGRLTYQVRMEGLEETWRETDITQARYPALAGGTYRFEVRAAQPGGPFGPSASLKVLILPAWWASWWFRTGAAATLALAAYLLFRWRVRILSHQKEALEFLVAARTREIEQARSELETANDTLRNQTLTDPLTGLRNRRFLDLTIQEEINRVNRLFDAGWREGRLPEREDLIFLLVDLDHFKAINDTFGHAAGDRVLEQVAGLLKLECRDSDYVVRMGGEEFLVLARNTRRQEAELMAERIRARVASHPFALSEERTIHRTCSLGFAAFPFQPAAAQAFTWEQVLNLADQCLYLAKDQGRDRWVGVSAKPELLAPGPRSEHWVELSDLQHQNLIQIVTGHGEGALA